MDFTMPTYTTVSVPSLLRPMRAALRQIQAAAFNVDAAAPETSLEAKVDRAGTSSGLPAGPTLAPNLYVIYINFALTGLLNANGCLAEVCLLLFAHDTVLEAYDAITRRSDRHTEQELSTKQAAQLDRVNRWMRCSLLTFSITHSYRLP